MEEDFYRGRLGERGLDVVVPDAADRAMVHRVIYDELVHDVVREESRTAYLEVVDRLAPPVPRPSSSGAPRSACSSGRATGRCPSYDTTALHVAAGVDWLCAD